MTAHRPLIYDSTGRVIRRLPSGDTLDCLITESALSLSDNTTGDASTSMHGFAPKLPNDATKYYNGSGAWAVPASLGEIPCTISNATGDPTNDITFSACRKYDSTGAYLLDLASPMTKKTDADFAAGDNAGGGNLSSSAWYHVFLIRKDSDGTIDAYFDTDGTAANKPAGYTAFRHVGWIYHSTSTGVTQFFQVGNRFYLKTKVRSIADQNPGTSAVLATISCPPNMIAVHEFTLNNSSLKDSYALVSSPSQTDSEPSVNLYTLCAVYNSMENIRCETLTDSSCRIRYRISYSSTNVWVVSVSDGWIDTLL